jgi:hypothetical protein
MVVEFYVATADDASATFFSSSGRGGGGASYLPSECFGHICSFLELKDCLSYGASSLSTTHQLFPELCRRRRMMKKRFAYLRDWKSIRGIESNKIGIWDEVQEKYPNTKWVSMPTVQEHVNELYRRMPSSHALYDMTAELHNELNSADCDEDVLHRNNITFQDLFPVHQQIMRAHQLHSKILFDAMDSNPLNGSNGTSLDQYMGDVFTVAYLVNHSTLGLVEGSPTNATFANIIRDEKPDSLGYKSWVFMHSSILRIKPFSSDQRDRLRIPDLCKVSEFLPNNCYLNEWFLSSKMTVVLDDFGPLGPVFRGRDVRRLRNIHARRLFAFFISNDNTQELSETTRSALDWLCLVHEEARKTRPMTVRIPVVRFYGNSQA